MKMKSLFYAVALITPALTSMALAQNMEEITVQGTRVLDVKDAGHTMAGIPLRDISLSYHVNIADLDLATQYGPIALERRVKDAATAACAELGQKYPLSRPDTAACAKSATDNAMVKARALVATAREKLPHE